MSTEADFEAPVVTEHTIEVRFRLTGERFIFRRFGRSLSPAIPDIERDPSRYLPSSRRLQQWELNWLARKLAENALSAISSTAAVLPIR